MGESHRNLVVIREVIDAFNRKDWGALRGEALEI